MEPEKTISVGVAAHITAASSGGPRYDPTLSRHQRKSTENGIWLCQNCAKLIDNDPSRYTVDFLRQLKTDAEAAAHRQIQSRHSPSVAIATSGIEIDMLFDKKSITPERHEYQLRVIVRNQAEEPLEGYYVQCEFPALVIESPEDHPLYVKGSSTDDISVFRKPSEQCPRIYPGEQDSVIKIRYFMDQQLYNNRGELLSMTVRATLYRKGVQPIVIEKVFGNLQIF
jgi:hypothetical protein